jgi:hypothetical protein
MRSVRPVFVRRDLAMAGLFGACVLAGATRGGDEPAGRRASDEELKTLLADLSKKGEEVHSLEVKFRQEKKLRILRRPRVSTGEVAFDGPPFKLSIVARDPEGKVESRLLIRDGELKIYYPALERMEVLPAGEEAAGGSGGAQAGQRVFQLLFTNQWEKIGKDYQAALMEETATAGATPGGATPAAPEKRWLLTLTPKKSDSKVKKLEVRLTGAKIREYFQEEASGDSVRFEVLEWKPNGVIPEDRFRLEVPAGTKVTRLGS